jgi:GTPase
MDCSAKPKIANYPFTTIIPNLGVWIPAQDNDQSSSLRGAGGEGLVFCDVPGLIKGASQGVGLGHAFLRHVERCHVVVHLVDATSNDPIADFEMLNEEIVRYGAVLAAIPQVVVVNKVDAYETSPNSNEWEEGLSVREPRDELETKLKAKLPHSRLMWMSAREQHGLNELMTKLSMFVRKVKETKEPVADRSS